MFDLTVSNSTVIGISISNLTISNLTVIGISTSNFTVSNLTSYGSFNRTRGCNTYL